MAENVGSYGWIKRETVNSDSDAVDENRRRALDNIAGRDLLAAGLEHPFLWFVEADAFRPPEN